MVNWEIIACWTISGVLAIGNIVCWVVVFRSRFFIRSNGHEISIGETEAKKIIGQLNEKVVELDREKKEFKKENTEFKQEIVELKQLLQKYLDTKK